MFLTIKLYCSQSETVKRLQAGEVCRTPRRGWRLSDCTETRKYLVCLRSVDQRSVARVYLPKIGFPELAQASGCSSCECFFKYQTPLLLSLSLAVCSQRHDSFLLPHLLLATFLIMVSSPFSGLIIFFSLLTYFLPPMRPSFMLSSHLECILLSFKKERCAVTNNTL